MIFDEVRKLKAKDHITKMEKIRFLKMVPDFVFGTLEDDLKKRDDAWLDDQFQYYLRIYAARENWRTDKPIWMQDK